MFIYALGKNIFSFNSKHCFARQEVIRKPFISNCYENFWKQKTLIYEKQNCVYLEDSGGVNKPGYKTGNSSEHKRFFFQVLCHIVSGFAFLAECISLAALCLYTSAGL